MLPANSVLLHPNSDRDASSERTSFVPPGAGKAVKDRALPGWLETVCSEIEDIKGKEDNGGAGVGKKTSSEIQQKCMKGQVQKGKRILQDLCFTVICLCLPCATGLLGKVHFGCMSEASSELLSLKENQNQKTGLDHEACHQEEWLALLKKPMAKDF